MVDYRAIVEILAYLSSGEFFFLIGMFMAYGFLKRVLDKKW